MKQQKRCAECGDRTAAMLCAHPTKPGQYVCEMCLEMEFSECSVCGELFHHPWIDSDNLDESERICDKCKDILR